MKNYLIDDILKYVKESRSKEEYNNIEKSYMNNSVNNYKLNRIQAIFFDNLKQIFNTYDLFLKKLDKKKVQL